MTQGQDPRGVPVERAETEPSPATPSETEDPVALRQALEASKAQAEQYLTSWQRALADYQNLRRRLEQEREDLSRQAIAQVILPLLPILDDLERALAHLDAKLTGFTWVEGIYLIERKLHWVLEQFGLEPVQAQGQPFEPTLHDALLYEEGEEGVVLQEIQKGYTLRGRVLRPALVTVGEGKPSPSAEEVQDRPADGDEPAEPPPQAPTG